MKDYNKKGGESPKEEKKVMSPTFPERFIGAKTFAENGAGLLPDVVTRKISTEVKQQVESGAKGLGSTISLTNSAEKGKSMPILGQIGGAVLDNTTKVFTALEAVDVGEGFKSAQKGVQDAIKESGGESQANPAYSPKSYSLIKWLNEPGLFGAFMSALSDGVAQIEETRLAKQQQAIADAANVSLGGSTIASALKGTDKSALPEKPQLGGASKETADAALDTRSFMGKAYDAVLKGAEKAGYALAPAAAAVRRPILAITDNKAVRTVGNFLGSPMVTNITSVAAAGITLQTALTAGLGGTVALAGVTVAAPVAAAAAGVALLAVGASVVIKARRVQQARNKELEHGAGEKIRENVKDISDNLLHLLGTNPELAASLSKELKISATGQSVVEPTVGTAVRKTLTDKLLGYVSSIFTTVVTISTAPFTAAMTALSSGLKLVTDLASGTTRQLAIDAEVAGIKQNTDNTLAAIGKDVSKLHGAKRTKAVLETTNEVEAGKRALNMMKGHVDELNAKGMPVNNEEMLQYFQECKKTQMALLAEKNPVKTASFFSSLGQTITSGFSMKSAAKADIPVCGPVTKQFAHGDAIRLAQVAQEVAVDAPDRDFFIQARMALPTLEGGELAGSKQQPRKQQEQAQQVTTDASLKQNAPVVSSDAAQKTTQQDAQKVGDSVQKQPQQDKQENQTRINLKTGHKDMEEVIKGLTNGKRQSDGPSTPTSINPTDKFQKGEGGEKVRPRASTRG